MLGAIGNREITNKEPNMVENVKLNRPQKGHSLTV